MKKYIFTLGALTILSLSLFGCSQDAGDSTQQVDSLGITTSQDSHPQVKKSNSGICHERGSTYYDRTSNFVPYTTIEDCLNSGGRLPEK